jgi:hypothetical protein
MRISLTVPSFNPGMSARIKAAAAATCGVATEVPLNSSFLEEMHNRGLMRTAAVAAAAPQRHRAFLAAAPDAGAPRDARS